MSSFGRGEEIEENEEPQKGQEAGCPSWTGKDVTNFFRKREKREKRKAEWKKDDANMSCEPKKKSPTKSSDEDDEQKVRKEAAKVVGKLLKEETTDEEGKQAIEEYMERKGKRLLLLCPKFHFLFLLSLPLRSEASLLRARLSPLVLFRPGGRPW